jgi:hypothetical protein
MTNDLRLVVFSPTKEEQEKAEHKRITMIQKRRDHQEYMHATHPTFATLWPRATK